MKSKALSSPRQERQFLRITGEGRRVLEAITTCAGRTHTALIEERPGIDLDAARAALQQLTAAARGQLRADGSGAGERDE